MPAALRVYSQAEDTARPHSIFIPLPLVVAAPHSLWQPSLVPRADSRRECVVAGNGSSGPVVNITHHQLHWGFDADTHHPSVYAAFAIPSPTGRDRAHIPSTTPSPLDQHSNECTLRSLFRSRVRELLILLPLLLFPSKRHINVTLVSTRFLHRVACHLIRPAPE